MTDLEWRNYILQFITNDGQCRQAILVEDYSRLVLLVNDYCVGYEGKYDISYFITILFDILHDCGVGININFDGPKAYCAGASKAFVTVLLSINKDNEFYSACHGEWGYGIVVTKNKRLLQQILHNQYDDKNYTSYPATASEFAIWDWGESYLIPTKIPGVYAGYPKYYDELDY